MNWLPGALSVLFVLLIVSLELYRRYGGRSEKVLGQILDKSSPGILGRKIYFLVIRVNGEDLHCETTAASWGKAQPGGFATMILMRGKFVRSVTMMQKLRPEERLRLQLDTNTNKTDRHREGNPRSQ